MHNKQELSEMKVRISPDDVCHVSKCKIDRSFTVK